jgi:hypothetical protein
MAEADVSTPQRGATATHPNVASLTPGAPAPSASVPGQGAVAAAPRAGSSSPSVAAPAGDPATPRSEIAALRPNEAAPPSGVPATVRPESARPGPQPPRFDVARVGARGALVTAGRAAPGAEVVLLENGREIGRARADARGEWVILPDAPLTPGARELTLSARLPGGEPLSGESSVVLVVPGPAPTVLADARPGPAGSTPESRPSTAEPPATPLALLVPAPGSQAPIRVLQAPAVARLSIDLVDYAGAAGMRFAGAAPAGAQLRLYVDDAPVGEVVADAQGRWSHSPQAQPAVGATCCAPISSAAGPGRLTRGTALSARRAARRRHHGGNRDAARGSAWGLPLAYRARHLWPGHSLHAHLRRQPRADPQSEPDLSGAGLQPAAQRALAGLGA